MSQTLWSEIDRYFDDHLLAADATLEAAQRAADAAGLPAIAVAPNQGKLLQLLALATGAERILEIGTLAGLSTIWLARALGSGGRVVTIERDPAHAEVARANFERAGVADRIELHVGAALDVLPRLGGAPFDLVFIDADKANNAAYFDWALKLARAGALIVVDNVVRGGSVLDRASTDAAVQGTRRLAERVGAEARVAATVLQTVGSKGHDGLLIALVLATAETPPPIDNE